MTEAPPLEIYRPLTGVTESEIVAAYRRTSEARPCLCGGIVVADRLDPAEGVREHQSDPRHMAWRDAHEI
jgi:hypothetical protein